MQKMLSRGLVLAVLASGFPLKASGQQKPPGMLDRIMNPDRQSKSSYEGRTFDPGGGFSGRTVATREYGGAKAFSSKEFTTRDYAGGRQNWLGNLLFAKKKLPENLQRQSRDAGKKFSSKELPLKSYGEPDKLSPYSGQNAYPTREVSLKGKSQGAIDNDLKLQEAVKKGLSIDDVRKLLNKSP